MPKKPNYGFEKRQREMAKAAKREAKREQKAASRAQKKDTQEPASGQPEGDDAKD